MVKLRMAAAAALLVLGSGTAFGGELDRCKVTDPTGTPLNVRDGPGGKVIGKLANGSMVAIVAHDEDQNGKTWAKVKDYKTKKPIGWVFREFVSCY